MKHSGPFLVAASLVLTCGLYILSKPAHWNPWASPLMTASQLTALLGTVLLSISFILAGRTARIERRFGGLDRVYRYHHIIGGVAFLLLLNHPLFLVLNALPDPLAALRYLIPTDNPAMLFGAVALWNMIVLLIFTLYVDMPYHIWKKTHELMGITILLGTVHMLMIPSDITNFLPLRISMTVWVGLGIGVYLYRRFLYRWLGPVYQYRVSRLQSLGETADLALTPLGRPMPYAPGQFAFLSVRGKRFPDGEHPFSITSHPENPELCFGIKNSGDFTGLIRTLEVGETVSVAGPHGSFGGSFFSRRPVLCVAGGIGITPFLSLVAAEIRRTDTDRPVTLYYTTRTKADAVFHDTLTNLTTGIARLRYALHCTSDQGRLTAEQLLDGRDSIGQLRVFLCGPSPMMTSLAEQFIRKGIRRRHIMYEDFSLR